MQQVTIQNKQTNKAWLAANSLLSVDGANNKYVSIPANDNLELHLDRDFSFSMVLIMPSNSGSYVLLNNRASISINSKGYTFYFANGFFGLEASNGSSLPNVSWGLIRSAGVTLQMVVCYTASSKTIEVFVNNMSIGTRSLAAFTGDYVSNQSLRVGKYTDDYGNHYKGSISHLAWYNKALTTLEIASLYNEVGLVPKSLHPNCVGFWTMQEIDGVKAYDSVEQFNYAKPQFVIDGELNTGTAAWTYPDTEGVTTFTSGTSPNKITITTTGTGTTQKVLQNNLVFSIKPGETYVLELDYEYTTTNFFVIALIDQTILRTGTGAQPRRTETFEWTAPYDGGGRALRFWFNVTEAGNTATIYGVKMYPKSTGKLLTPNHANLIGYSGAADLLDHTSWTTTGIWTYDSGTGTVSHGNNPSGGSGAQVTVRETMTEEDTYCLSYTATTANGSGQDIIFLNNNGDYVSLAGVANGANKYYFRGRDGNSITLMTNTSPIGTMSANSFKLEKLPTTVKKDIYTKVRALPKIKFNSPSKYLQMDNQSYTNYTDIANNPDALFIMDFSAAKLSSTNMTDNTYLFQSRWFSIRLGRDYAATASNDVHLFATIWDPSSGPVVYAIYNMGNISSLPNTRIIIKYSTVSGLTRRLDIWKDNVMVATHTATLGREIEVPVVPSTFFKAGVGDEIEVAYFRMFTGIIPDSWISTPFIAPYKDTFCTYGNTVFEGNMEQYSRRITIRPAHYFGTQVTMYDSSTCSFVGFTQQELDNSVVAPNDHLPMLKNAVYAGRTGAEFLLNVPIETSVKSIGTGDFSLHTSFFVNDYAFDDRVFYFRGADSLGVWGLMFYKTRLQVFQSFNLPGTGAVQLILYSEVLEPLKGAYTFTFNRTLTNRYEAILNGRKIPLNIYGGSTAYSPYDSFVDVAIPYGTAAPWNLSTDLGYISFPNYSNYIVNFGIKAGAMTMEEHMNLHKNGQFANPVSLRNYKAYYQFDKTNTGGTTWPDLSGHQTGASSATTLTSTTINSLR